LTTFLKKLRPRGEKKLEGRSFTGDRDETEIDQRTNLLKKKKR